MASELKLSGSAAGRIIVQGNDTITTDQTFTFPTTGGTLATQPSNGSVPGYQQGSWTPVVAQTNDNTKAVTDYSNRVGNWVRIGNLVTVYFTLNMASGSSLSDLNQALCLIDFPYKTIARAGYYASSSSIHANGWTDAETVFVNILIGQDTSKTNGIYYARSNHSGTYRDGNYSVIGAGSIIGQLTYLTDDTTWTPQNGATVS